mmetsp:Transcript_53095/g.113389  ORF Transcript_53095/g.113389 Transcript_53095/m.113389 type:complete len:218 (+) Transcript_53095:185-838(+)
MLRGSSLLQNLHQLWVGGVFGRRKGCLVLGGALLEVGSKLHQAANHLSVALLDSHQQRRGTVGVAEVLVCTRFDQVRNHLHMVPESSLVERGVADGPLLLFGRTIFAEHLNHLQMPLHRRHKEWCGAIVRVSIDVRASLTESAHDIDVTCLSSNQKSCCSITTRFLVDVSDASLQELLQLFVVPSSSQLQYRGASLLLLLILGSHSACWSYGALFVG